MFSGFEDTMERVEVYHLAVVKRFKAMQKGDGKFPVLCGIYLREKGSEADSKEPSLGKLPLLGLGRGICPS